MRAAPAISAKDARSDSRTRTINISSPTAKRARSSDGGAEEEEDQEAEEPAASPPGDADRSFSATPADGERHDGH